MARRRARRPPRLSVPPQYFSKTSLFVDPSQLYNLGRVWEKAVNDSKPSFNDKPVCRSITWECPKQVAILLACTDFDDWVEENILMFLFLKHRKALFGLKKRKDIYVLSFLGLYQPVSRQIRGDKFRLYYQIIRALFMANLD